MSREYDLEPSAVAPAAMATPPVKRAGAATADAGIRCRRSAELADGPCRPATVLLVASSGRIPLLMDGPFAETKELLVG